MRRLYYQFLVDSIVDAGDGRFHAIGRGGDFPVRVGDPFDCAYRYRPRKHPEEAGHRPIREVEKDVSIRVVGVHAYQRWLPELGEAMTGLLVLEGEGFDRVEDGWILGSTDDRPPERAQSLNPAEETAAR